MRLVALFRLSDMLVALPLLGGLKEAYPCDKAGGDKVGGDKSGD